MNSADRYTRPPRLPPSLMNGDRLKQPEFHRRYLGYPGDVKIELIGGVVYVASPQRRAHGRYQLLLARAALTYEDGTPGVEGLDNTTTILSEESEPQPDLSLRILSAFHGRSRETEDDYVEGPSEMMMEIAHSTRAIDLHQKKSDYDRAGVCEYMVLCVEERELHWFNFRTGKPIVPNKQGIMRSQVFPGLWIDAAALIERDSKRLLRVVRLGLRSREHAAFVR